MAVLPAAPTTPPLTARRILVVDDQPSIRGVLQLALSEAGAVVSAVGDGTTALRLIRDESPELVLLDLAMPGVDGWEVLQQMRLTPRTSAIPVVLQTSAEDFPTYERARSLGVAAFVSKPFRLGDLVETCRRVIHGARPLQGRLEPDAVLPKVTVVRAHGDTVTGDLLEMDLRGAQLQLPAPLAIGDRVTLTFPTQGVPEIASAEVRWVSAATDSVYCHGLVFR